MSSRSRELFRTRPYVCSRECTDVALSSSTLADRFLPLAHALHLDLATGDRAWLRIAPATRGPEAVRWNERCAALTTLWHPGTAECLDVGLLGPDTRFEAYRVNGLLPLRSARPI